jgi:hypothetical protein
MSVISIENVHILITNLPETVIFLGPSEWILQKTGSILQYKKSSIYNYKNSFYATCSICFRMQVGCETSVNVRPSTLPKKLLY